MQAVFSNLLPFFAVLTIGAGFAGCQSSPTAPPMSGPSPRPMLLDGSNEPSRSAQPIDFWTPQTPGSVPAIANEAAVTNAQESPGEPSMSIDDYVTLALRQNPRLLEAERRIEALQARIPQSLALPDPQLMTTTHLSPVQTAAGAQRFALGVQQQVPRVSKRETRAAIVMDQIEAAHAELRSLELEIAEQVRSGFYQLLFLEKAIEITRQDAESLELIAEATERRYELDPAISQRDILSVQVGQAELDARLAELQQRAVSQRARLVRLLHLPAGSELPVSEAPTPDLQALNLDELIERALDLRPDLQAQWAAIRRDQKQVHLAALESQPDWMIGVNWIATSTSGLSPVANGDDAVMLNVGFNLPVYRQRIRAAISEAQSNLSGSMHRLEGLQDEVAEEIFDIVAQVESQREILDLLDNTIIPRSERALELALTQYEVGRFNYDQLIESWRVLFRQRIAAAEVEAQLNRSMARLDRAIATPTGDRLNRDSNGR